MSKCKDYYVGVKTPVSTIHVKKICGVHGIRAAKRIYLNTFAFPGTKYHNLNSWPAE